MRICFLDCETTGLDLESHEIWEVGVIVRNTDRQWDEAEYDTEHRWFLPMFNFNQADPFALDIGKFWERYVWPDPQQYTKDYMSEWCRMWSQMTRGATIVGAVPNFDVERLDLLCKRYGYRMFNHYHLVCCENLVAGKYGIAPPWKSEELTIKAGLNPVKYEDEKHSALGDCRWARDMYDSVMNNAH